MTTATEQSHAESHLKYWSKTPPSDAGIRVAALLDAWGGLHHFDSNAMKKVDWSNDRFIEIKLSKFESVGQLSTFDFDQLTSLVFLAHDRCIRVSISPCNGTHMRLIFNPRAGRDGDHSIRHPTLEHAVDQWRTRHSETSV